MTAPVPLRPAYSWECPRPGCGAKNWEEPVYESTPVRPVAPSDIATIPGIDASWTISNAYGRPPEAVRCRGCGEAFAAQGG